MKPDDQIRVTVHYMAAGKPFEQDFERSAPVGDVKEVFQLRLLWNRYPDDPPSLKFRETESGRLDAPKSWPQVPGFRPNTLDACVSYCSEGFALHPEWRSDPHYRWDPRGNPLL